MSHVFYYTLSVLSYINFMRLCADIHMPANVTFWLSGHVCENNTLQNINYAHTLQSDFKEQKQE